MMSYKKFPVYFIIPILLILGMTISACQPKEVSDPVKILPGQVDDMIHVKTMKKRRQWLNQCDANNYTACAKLASDLSHFNKDGKFNETIHNEKRRLYEKACDGGHKEACNAVANYLIHYDKTATSIEAGHKILHQNCKIGSAPDCLNYSAVLRASDRLVEARKVNLNYCKIIGSVGCHEFTTDMLEGRYGQADTINVRELSAYGCDEGYIEACIRIATLHDSGIGGPKNPILVGNYLRRICDLSKGEKCWDSLK